MSSDQVRNSKPRSHSCSSQFSGITMSFTRLPNEILEYIIEYSLGEGFESLALTCKHFHELCSRYFKHYNELRFHFQKFSYNKTNSFVKSYLQAHFQRPNTVCSAYNLIARIAIEPTIANYIREADFREDSWATERLVRELATIPERDEAVARLLAGSPYLKEAGLDWKEYLAAIDRDLEVRGYSQHAATFVLTLLPYLEVIELPRRWKPVAATDKLLNAVIQRARRASSNHQNSALERVTRFKFPNSRRQVRTLFDPSWAVPFFYLPNIESFWSKSCARTSDGDGRIVPLCSHSSFSTLEAIYLEWSYLDEAAITGLLRHTPNLKTFTYSHFAKTYTDLQDWDMCRFVMAIEREVGSHLVELSIILHDSPDEISITPGKVSMCGFSRLQKLEIPLELAMCNIRTSAPTDSELDDSASLLRDLVPTPVSHLSLTTLEGNDDHVKAIDLMFRGFAAKKETQLPMLEEIQLLCYCYDNKLCKETRSKLAAEAQKAGVTFSRRDWTGVADSAWKKKWKHA